MINALYSAASGMIAQQTSIDVLANNLANAGTIGFKRDRMDQVDLAYRTFQLPTGQAGQVGLGSAPGGIGKEMTEGEFEASDRPLDVAINGQGFLQVTRPDGTLAYTRAGALSVDREGRVMLNSGELLQPRITIPPGATDVKIGPDGAVTANVNDTITKLGDIQLATFPNPGGLLSIGGSLFIASANSGTVSMGAADSGGRGAILQGYTEASNVQVANEMVSMVATQRAFEASARIVSASDEMWGIANGLRR